MSEATTRLQRKLKAAAYLLILGLGTEAATLYWSTPASFLFFIAVGGLLVVAGIMLYLLAIVNQ